VKKGRRQVDGHWGNEEEQELSSFIFHRDGKARNLKQRMVVIVGSKRGVERSACRIGREGKYKKGKGRGYYQVVDRCGAGKFSLIGKIEMGKKGEKSHRWGANGG